MNEPMETVQRWFWVSLVMLVFYSWILLFKTRNPEAWRRYNAAETAFWSRFGLPRRVAELLRRFGDSKASTFCLWVIVILFALLVVLNGGTYLYFKDKIAAQRQPGTTQPAQPVQPTR